MRTIAKFLDSAGGRPSALLMQGEAGVGKTTLWLAALDQARERGFRVLSARASEAETVLAYGTVADLLGDVDEEILAGLPGLQRLAVDRVLLHDAGGGPATDQRVVAASLVSVIEQLSERAPVLIGMDDLQWLDQSSQAVIAFVSRRLRGRAGLLVTERVQPDHGSAVSWLQLGTPDGIDRIQVSPLSINGLHGLISARLGRSFARPTMVRIAEVSGGNPFYALELARALADRAAPGEALLPPTLSELVRSRIGNLNTDARDVLLAAASVADPTVEMIVEATGATAERTTDLLDEAETMGIIAMRGNRVQFSHPLLAHGVYIEAGPAQRRRMHRKLADVVSQPELRARHLALAASSTDPELLRTLDGAAGAARARGAPAAAAELLDLAIRLGGDTPMRRTQLAENHLRAGNIEEAGAILSPVIRELAPGPLRATALCLLAGVRIFHDSFIEAAVLLQRAVRDADGNQLIMVQSLSMLAFAQSSAGENDEALRNAELAVIQAEELGIPSVISQALAIYVTINALDGNGVDEQALARALELEDPDFDTSIAFRAEAANAQLLSWTGRLDEAQCQYQQLRRRCVERGAESELMFVAVYSALVDIWRGRYSDAAEAAQDAVERAEQIGGNHLLVIARTMRGAAAAYSGRVSEARADADAAMAIAARCGSAVLANWPLCLAGFLEASLGNYAAALTALRPLCDYFEEMPGTEIMTASYVGDAVEAMIGLDRLDEAEPMIKTLEHNGRWLDRPWMLAIGGRCRGMLFAAQGDVEAAESALREAMTGHNRLPMPFERARTQLFLGQLLRRRRQKREAAATIGEALRVFEELGSTVWAERARAELTRTKVSPTHGRELTPSEQRVAELAASGMTTADVAVQLCVSVKTVQANMTQIYRKLGIHSRAELGRLMGRASGQ